MEPRFNARMVRGWIDRGATHVVANVRGGGEYGARWHRAAVRENRQRSIDDLHAVAADVVRRGIVESSELVGATGASHGGFLVLNAYLQRPDLYGAVCAVAAPTDLERDRQLHHWQHGRGMGDQASEVGDFTNQEEWDAFISKFSPIHNVDEDWARSQAPPPLLVAHATNDDVVHPARARTFVDKLRQLGKVNNVWYYEARRGGHTGWEQQQQQQKLGETTTTTTDGGPFDLDLLAFRETLVYDFLYGALTSRLKEEKNPPPEETTRRAHGPPRRGEEFADG